MKMRKIADYTKTLELSELAFTPLTLIPAGMPGSYCAKLNPATTYGAAILDGLQYIVPDTYYGVLRELESEQIPNGTFMFFETNGLGPVSVLITSGQDPFPSTLAVNVEILKIES